MSAVELAPRKRGYYLPGIIALVVLVGMSVVFALTALRSYDPRVLHGPDVAQSLAEGLQVGATPPTVRCPAAEPRRPGVVFDCTLLRPGRAPRTIQVTVTTPQSLRYRLLPTG
ncbi:MAG: DUF4333 domain-containing protein [Acidimicrobiales bacterium]